MTIQVMDQPFEHNCGAWCGRAEPVAVRTASMDDAEWRVAQIQARGWGDASLSNGLIRSSKEISAYDDGTFGVFHGIDGSMTYFTRAGLIEVFRGERDIWEGDIEE